MNMISQLRRRVSESETGEATITLEEFNQLQAEWITRAQIEISDDRRIYPNNAKPTENARKLALHSAYVAFVQHEWGQNILLADIPMQVKRDLIRTRPCIDAIDNLINVAEAMLPTHDINKTINELISMVREYIYPWSKEDSSPDENLSFPAWEFKELVKERDALKAEVERLTPLQFRPAPCHARCEAAAFNIEIRKLKAEER